jgi:hypothetical protein
MILPARIINAPQITDRGVLAELPKSASACDQIARVSPDPHPEILSSAGSFEAANESSSSTSVARHSPRELSRAVPADDFFSSCVFLVSQLLKYSAISPLENPILKLFRPLKLQLVPQHQNQQTFDLS